MIAASNNVSINPVFSGGLLALNKEKRRLGPKAVLQFWKFYENELTRDGLSLKSFINYLVKIKPTAIEFASAVTAFSLSRSIKKEELILYFDRTIACFRSPFDVRDRTNSAVEAVNDVDLRDVVSVCSTIFSVDQAVPDITAIIEQLSTSHCDMHDSSVPIDDKMNSLKIIF